MTQVLPRRVANAVDTRAPALGLQVLADELLAEAAAGGSLQASRPLPDSVSGLRQTLIALTGPVSVTSSEDCVAGSVHVLRGTARLVAGEICTELATLDDAPLPRGHHVISADAAAVLVLSVVVAPHAPLRAGSDVVSTAARSGSRG